MRDRELSISTSFDYTMPIDAQLELAARVGFTHVSLGENADHSGILSPTRRRHLTSLFSQHGLRLDTVHGPRLDTLADGRLVATLEAAAELGAPVVVAHAGPFDFPASELPRRLDVLEQACRVLAPVLAQTGVKLALENVLPGPATDLVRRALPQLDSSQFGFCYDSAHDQIGGPRPFTILEELGNRLTAVHLSDRIREFVDHVPPGDGFLDWPKLCARLRRTPFRGPLLLEVMVLHSAQKEPAQLLPITYERACNLYDQIFQ
jgi:sugar phosphate isomerase/epimerase